ncbi:GNAT family N-acetyltransferase [Prescottella equi]|uniref:GNAT family N-acetyltransferase n=1 Tax=Rhodococcus hoagii TaxID=43767 RepID=UPI0025778B9B|nr:GNAT family N-acetyltransferase [Prescottella equi]WJJ13701.1 GNAT family N-acetyltransferase [Prescottella equi]
MNVVIRPGQSEDSVLLSELAMRSKGFWGYSDEFLELCRHELTLNGTDVLIRRTAVAESCGTVVGFVTVDGTPPDGELGMLFVAPEAIGGGIGTELFRHALNTAHQAGFRRLAIESEPRAEPFYRAMGAVRIGSVASTLVPCRELPLMEVNTIPTL